MKKQNYPNKIGTTIASKAALLFGALWLLTGFQNMQAQCPVTITPTGSVNLCSGGSVLLTATSGATYLWSNGATTQAITATAAGNYTVIVDDGAGCIDTSDATTVTLFSAIPGGISTFTGPTKACPGDSHVYSVVAPPRAVSYTWTFPTGATSGGLSTLTTTSTSLTVDFDAGFVSTGVISVVVSNGCGSRPPVNKTVSRNNPATPASISGPIVTCENTTYSYTTPLVTGITSYNWQVPTGATLTGQGTNAVDITFPAGYLSGTVRVSATNACNTSGTRNLNTRSLPSPPQPINGPTAGLCNTTQTYWIPPVAGASSYTWTAPAGSNVTSGQGDTLVTIFFNSSLNNGYVRVVANNACGASGETKLRVDGEVIITTNPVDSNDLCENTTLSLNVFAQGGGVSYQWRKDGINLVDGGNISGATTENLIITPLSLTDAGIYDAIVSNACSDPDTSDESVVAVRPAPVAPAAIIGDNFGCPGTTGNVFSVTPDPLNDSYEWFAFDGATIASGQGTPSVTIDFGPNVNSGYTLAVRGINDCGPTLTVTKWVRRSISTPQFATAPVISCAGTSNDYEVTPVSGATSYTWIAPANASVGSGQGTETATIDFGAQFTTGKVCVTASNQCMTTPQRCVNVVAAPLKPGAINGGLSKGVCNTSQVYTVNAVGGASTYLWTAPTGATVSAGQGTNTVTVDYGPTFVTGDLTVVAQNTCGDSPERTRVIQAFPAKPTAINGNLAPCVNSTGNVYSVDPLFGATSYDWVVPAGATITAGQGTDEITVDFGTTAGSIRVRGVNACGNGFFGYFTIAFSCRMQVATAGAQEAAVSIYPNPTSSNISITHQEGVEGNVHILVTDLAGRVVLDLNENVNGSSITEIDLSTLNNGIYMVDVTSNLGKSISKIVKE